MDEIVKSNNAEPDLVKLPMGLKLPLGSYMLYVEEFLSMRDYAAKSRPVVVSALTLFYGWLVKNPDGAVVEYRDYLAVTGKKKKSYVQTTFSILRTFFDFLIQKEVVVVNPFKSIVVRRKLSELDQRRILSDDEITAIVNALDHIPPRISAVAALMLNTGLRCQAIANAKLKHIDYQMETPRLFVKHKGHSTEDMYVWLNPMVMHYMKKWLRVRPVSKDDSLLLAYKFPHQGITYFIIRRDLRTLFDMCNIRNRSPHCLRHTAITLARRAGASMLDVKMMAGHSDIKTTELYDHSARRITHAPELAIYNILRRNEYESKS